MASIPSLARPLLRLHRPGLPLLTVNSKLRRYSGGRGGMRGRRAVCELRAGNSAYTAPSSTDHGSESSVLSPRNRRAKKRRHGPRSWPSGLWTLITDDTPDYPYLLRHPGHVRRDASLFSLSSFLVWFATGYSQTWAELATPRPSPAAANTPFRVTWAAHSLELPSCPCASHSYGILASSNTQLVEVILNSTAYHMASSGQVGFSMQHVVALVVAIVLAVTLTVEDRDTTLPYAYFANCIFLLYNLTPAGVGLLLRQLQHSTRDESLESPEATLRDYAAWSLATV
ncbi:hypothetical protein BDP55DRAFT_626556 [Colletotrichum godetiae]|uniref:Uncharacterized protein n=1 Tax=Colletotrichum godetiae TaxID=1209918 RepID=A0AAJ0EZA6_9PEZI|nr:uncharacterized protein BDP55DRAFT_626556 [Colletotrichum godetiae]KAK1699868.1 hypothetical protein BDP55DRAFT_626556 [Colletotrichum godetiae]